MKNLQNIVKNIQNSKKFQGSILESVIMKDHTTFKVGGKAEYFALPETEQSLLFLLNELRLNNIEYFILGGGSNVVVADEGISGVVVSSEKFQGVQLLTKNDNFIVHCDAGCTIDKLIQFCIDNELSGLENFAGLPGSVGGALYMNARCYNFSISDVLQSARYTSCIDNYSSTKEYTMNLNDWNYKLSPFQDSNQKKIVLSADFLVKKGSKEQITKDCEHFIFDRKDKGHFAFPSAGSVFKNNRSFGKSSGEIIDSVGLKGYKIGSAQVAPFHGNLIINIGDARAEDIKSVVKHVQKEVYKKAGFNLECEILFVGNF